jgi:hypothetical protein
MNKFDRRSTLAIGLAAVSAAVIKPAAAQTTDYKDTTPAPGVVVRAYSGETPSIIPGFKTVSMRDVIRPIINRSDRNTPVPPKPPGLRGQETRRCKGRRRRPPTTCR